MFRICFVCYGNICRSPMAEFIFKDLIFLNNKRYKMSCTSRATSFEEIGNDIDPEAKKVLDKNKINIEKHKAKVFKKEDYKEFDLIIVMENKNLNDIINIIGEDNENKIHKLREFSGDNIDIEDPWYTGRFEYVYSLIYEGCLGLFNYILKLGDAYEV